MGETDKIFMMMIFIFVVYFRKNLSWWIILKCNYIEQNLNKMDEESGSPENKNRNAKVQPEVRLVPKSVPSGLLYGIQ